MLTARRYSTAASPYATQPLYDPRTGTPVRGRTPGKLRCLRMHAMTRGDLVYGSLRAAVSWPHRRLPLADSHGWVPRTLALLPTAAGRARTDPPQRRQWGPAHHGNLPW
eukprot:2281240-Rhodomonas_salina.3